MGDFGLDTSDQWLADWSASISERATQAQQLASKVSQLSASAVSPQRDVRVTVGSGGQMLNLELAERTRMLPAAQLARLILDTMRRAQARLPDLVAAVANETVGAESSAAESVITAFQRRFPRSPEDPLAQRKARS